MRRPVRVGLYGGFGTGNTGNDATAAVAVEHLRRTQPDLDLRLITYGPRTDEVAARLGIPTISTQPVPAPVDGGAGPPRTGPFPLGPLRPAGVRAARLLREGASAWRALRSVDAVVVLGCGIFEAESTVGGRGWRAMADLYLVSLASSLGPHRLAYAAIGGTVLPTRAERRLVVAAMRRAERRSFRDAESKAALAQMGGGHDDDLVVADLVFAADLVSEAAGVDAPRAEVVPPGDTLDPDGAVHHAGVVRASQRPQVALGVMSFDWLRRDGGGLSPQDTYLGALIETAVALVEEGQDVVVFAGDVADRAAVDLVAGEAQRRLDGRADTAQSGHAGDPGDRVATLYATTLTEQVPVLSAADTVIGSRFHNAVTALMLGKVPIVVADRTKIRTLMHTMDLDAQVVEARSLTSAALLALVAQSQADRVQAEERTFAAVQDARAGAVRGLEDLGQLVEHWDRQLARTDGGWESLSPRARARARTADAASPHGAASSDVSVV